MPAGMAPDPMGMLAMILGSQAGGSQDTTGQMIEQIITLLRRVSEKDPRVAPVTGAALEVMLRGPSALQGPASGATAPAMGSIPIGGPGSVA